MQAKCAPFEVERVHKLLDKHKAVVTARNRIIADVARVAVKATFVAMAQIANDGGDRRSYVAEIDKETRAEIRQYIAGWCLTVKNRQAFEDDVCKLVARMIGSRVHSGVAASKMVKADDWHEISWRNRNRMQWGPYERNR